MRLSLLLVMVICLGCGGPPATEGKVTITTTAGFSKMHGSKSPPPQKPKQ
jgi:hypothetical protein